MEWHARAGSKLGRTLGRVHDLEGGGCAYATLMSRPNKCVPDIATALQVRNISKNVVINESHCCKNGLQLQSITTLMAKAKL